MPARIDNIAFDCDDVPKMAAFRSAVLGRPLDEGSGGVFASSAGTDPARQEPAWYFKVPDPSIGARSPDLIDTPARSRYGPLIINKISQ